MEWALRLRGSSLRDASAVRALLPGPAILVVLVWPVGAAGRELDSRPCAGGPLPLATIACAVAVAATAGLAAGRCCYAQWAGSGMPCGGRELLRLPLPSPRGHALPARTKAALSLYR